MRAQIHLHPTAALAARVLLPGDPGRALRLAQSLLQAPKMFNHHRGLWGYTGTAADGELLTIQTTGIGGPSAAIVIHELAELGATTLLRVGTCGALNGSWRLGELLIATEALVADGTSRALGAGARVPASPELVEALTAAGGAEVRAGPVVSTDLFYDPVSRAEGWRDDGALAVEMETAALLTLAAIRGLRAGSLLVVSDLVLPARRRIGPEDLTVAEHRLGELGQRALAALPLD